MHSLRSLPATLLLASLLVPAAARAGEISPSTIATLTNVITVALSRHEQLDVLSSADVRRVVALEADKQAVGCSDDTSCLAEVAGAMGARLVVFGQLGDLDGELVLTLNLFDSEAASAAGRVLLRADDARALSDDLEAAVDRLVGRTLSSLDEGERIKVLVLDLEAGGALPPAGPPSPPPSSTSSASSTTAPEATPWLFYGGGATAGVGLLVLGGGAVLGGLHVVEVQAGEAEPLAAEALKRDRSAQLYALLANGLFGLGTGLLVVGAGLAAAQLVVGGAE